MNKRLIMIFILFSLMSIIIPASVSCGSMDKTNMPVVLLTDYGSEDYRIAQLKGIILSNNRNANIIDASHSIPSFDIHTGAYILDIAAREFPGDVIFISTIAAYKQTEIKFLVITTGKKQIFVLPDNGLLTYVNNDQEIKSIYRITNQQLFNKPLSELSAEQIQGKIAALISSGYKPQDCGSLFTNPVTLDIQEPQVNGQKLLGTVVFVDHFGNCVTNIPGDSVKQAGISSGDTVQVIKDELIIKARFGNVYSDVPQGDPVVLTSSNLGVVQLSINLGNFSTTYNIKAGTKIEIDK